MLSVAVKNMSDIIDGWGNEKPKTKILYWRTTAMDSTADWWETIELCKTIGDGWRLPTREEIHEYYMSYTHTAEKNRAYWIDGVVEREYAEYYSFITGMVHRCEKDTRLYYKFISEK